MGQVFEFAQNKHGPAAFRQCLDRSLQQLDFLLATDDLRDRGRIIYDVQTVDFRYGKSLRDRPAPEKVTRRVARRREKQPPGRTHLPRRPYAQQAGVGFLHQIVDIPPSRDAMQVTAQRRFMRLHFLGEPTGRIGILGGASR